MTGDVCANQGPRVQDSSGTRELDSDNALTGACLSMRQFRGRFCPVELSGPETLTPARHISSISREFSCRPPPPTPVLGGSRGGEGR